MSQGNLIVHSEVLRMQRQGTIARAEQEADQTLLTMGILPDSEKTDDKVARLRKVMAGSVLEFGQGSLLDGYAPDQIWTAHESYDNVEVGNVVTASALVDTYLAEISDEALVSRAQDRSGLRSLLLGIAVEALATGEGLQASADPTTEVLATGGEPPFSVGELEGFGMSLDQARQLRIGEE